MKGGSLAYGWGNCANLANNDDEADRALQLKNADNYRLFALAAFFDRVEWDAHGRKK